MRILLEDCHCLGIRRKEPRAQSHEEWVQLGMFRNLRWEESDILIIIGRKKHGATAMTKRKKTRKWKTDGFKSFFVDVDLNLRSLFSILTTNAKFRQTRAPFKSGKFKSLTCGFTDTLTKPNNGWQKHQEVFFTIVQVPFWVFTLKLKPESKETNNFKTRNTWDRDHTSWEIV